MNQAEEFRSGLERKVRAEARHGWDRARKQWDRPLPERVLSGRAIGWLRISSVETVRKTKLVHFYPSAEDMAIFREGDKVRMSLNDPDGGDFIQAMFLGLTEKGLSVTIPMERDLPIEDGWTLDETMIDLSDFYLKALDEMATTSHGRDVVLPALLNGVGDAVDFEAHADFSEALEDSGLDDSQTDGVRCVWRSCRQIYHARRSSNGRQAALVHGTSGCGGQTTSTGHCPV